MRHAEVTPTTSRIRLASPALGGENLYIADGRYGAPRPALDGWLNSPGHRENLFNPDWHVQSVYVVRLSDFPGFKSPTLWVSEFGA
jgi:hypothetical protein